MKVETQPKVDHTPAELDEPSRLLLKAAGLIEQHGLCKGSQTNDAGNLCIYGALIKAWGHTNLFNIDRWSREGYQEVKAKRPMPEPIRDAAARVSQSVGGVTADTWNNEDARTADEVVAKLRAVALGL